MAWLIAQVSAIVLPAFSAPQYVMKILISVLIAGFPISVVFAWVYQFSPKGIRKIQNVDAEPIKAEEPKNQLPKNNKKLVVLPFQNIGSENGSNYFSDGLTEEIIIRLSGIKELDIASRSTSMRYRDSELDITSLGRALNARYIL